MIRTVIAALAVLILASMPDAFPDDLAGRASIIEGDTLEIHGTRIRLWGIDAPESDQLCRTKNDEHYRCGQEAANDLDSFILRRPVNALKLIVISTSAPLQSARSLVSTSPIGWCATGMRSTGPNIQRVITLPHRTKQSAQSAACGAAVLLSLGAIALAEEQVDHLLAAPISYSDSAVQSICRGPARRRSPDTTGSMESEIQRGTPLPYARGCRAQTA
jgi:hypothetical protein